MQQIHFCGQPWQQPSSNNGMSVGRCSVGGAPCLQASRFSCLFSLAFFFLIHNTGAASTSVIDCQGTLLPALHWWVSLCKCLCVCVRLFEWLMNEKESQRGRERKRDRGMWKVICDFVIKCEVVRNSSYAHPDFFSAPCIVREVIWIFIFTWLSIFGVICLAPVGCRIRKKPLVCLI